MDILSLIKKISICKESNYNIAYKTMNPTINKFNINQHLFAQLKSPYSTKLIDKYIGSKNWTKLVIKPTEPAHLVQLTNLINPIKNNDFTLLLWFGIIGFISLINK